MLVHEMNNTLEQILQILDGFSQDWTFYASGKYVQATNVAYRLPHLCKLEIFLRLD